MVITGVNGFIGRSARAYFQKQYEMTGIDLAASYCEEGVQIHYYQCNMSKDAQELANILTDVQPDVVGLQEAMDFQILMITENHEQYEAVGVGRDDGKKEGEQTAIVYNKKKIALQKWGTFWLSDTPDSPSKGWDAACKRTATWALMKCKKTGRKFYFVNTHLDHVGEEAREKGLALVVGRINSMNKDRYPVVLTGDFNMKAGHRSFSGLESIMKNARTSAETTDTHHSYNGWGKSSSVIDYIYYSGFSACRKFSTVTKPYAERKFISDHFPISAELVF